MNNNKDDNKKDKKFLIGLISLLVILVIVIVATTFILKNNKDKQDTELAYTDLIKEISEGKIEKVEMTVGSTSIKVKVKDDEKEKNSIVPNTEAFITLVQQKVAEGNQIELIQKQKNGFIQFLTILINFFPTFIMIALFVMIYKMQGLGGEKGKVYEDTERKTRKVNLQASTKTSDGRTIPLIKSAEDILNSIKSKYQEINSDGFIINNSDKMVHVDTLSDSYTNIAKTAGIKNPLGIHTLRHTFASLLIKKGVDIKIVSDILGHKDVSFTYNIYVHILEEQKTQAMSLLDDI